MRSGVHPCNPPVRRGARAPIECSGRTLVKTEGAAIDTVFARVLEARNAAAARLPARGDTYVGASRSTHALEVFWIGGAGCRRAAGRRRSAGARRTGCGTRDAVRARLAGQ